MIESPFPAAPEIATEPAACGMCGAAAADPYAESFDYEYGTCSNRWQFVRCRACGNVYLNPRPRRDTLGVIYPPTYYSYNYDQQIHPIARRAKAILDARTFRWIRRQLDLPLEAYLDVGCGNGRYLRVMAAAGIAKDKLYGTELDEKVARDLSAEGFNVRAALFEDAELPAGFFQLITFFSVLEHVAEPRLMLARAHALLAPGGIVVCEVPNIESLNARLFRYRYWGGYHTPRHWNLFSAETLARTAGELGYELKTLRRTTGHAFWLYSFHHYLRYEKGWDRLGRWLNPRTCIPGLAIVTGVDLVRARLSQQTDNMIAVLRKTRR